MSKSLNNQLFGNDSYDKTDNYNQKVDITKEIALERAAKFIMMNANLIDSDEDFEITIGAEPFLLTEFWREWLFLIFNAFIPFVCFLAIWYVKASKNEDKARLELFD